MNVGRAGRRRGGGGGMGRGIHLAMVGGDVVILLITCVCLPYRDAGVLTFGYRRWEFRGAH